MNKREMIAAFGALRGDAIVVTSQGASSGLIWELAEHPATIYSMELGYTSSVAMGIAWGVPQRRVVAFEGDGSLFAGAPILGTISRYPPPNLIVVVVANGVWGTGDGSVETTTAHVARWPELAAGCGWQADRVFVAREAAAFGSALGRAFHEPGPWFIIAETERGAEDRSGNPGRKELRESRNDAVESIDATRRDIREHR